MCAEIEPNGSVYVDLVSKNYFEGAHLLSRRKAFFFFRKLEKMEQFGK